MSALAALAYQQALDRVHADFQEMPGMRLTPAQVQRLCGVDSAICMRVLEDLAGAMFLRRCSDGSYAKWSNGDPCHVRAGGGEHDAARDAHRRTR